MSQPSVQAAPSSAPDPALPSNLEAEQALLGSCLIDEDAIFIAVGIVKPKDFFLEKHSWIFDAMVRLFERSIKLDYLLVISELESHSRLADVGGSAYIAAIMNAVPTAAHVEHYAKLVFALSQMRRLIYASTQIAQMAFDCRDLTNTEQVIAKSHQLIDRVPLSQEGGGATTLAAAVDLFEADLDRMVANPSEVWGTATGLRMLDSRFGGLVPGDFWILAGDPSMGKTALLNKIMLNVASKGVPAIYFTLEMSIRKLMLRLAADLSRIPYKRIRQGKLSPADQDLIRAKMREIRQYPLMLIDKPISTTGIRNQLIRITRTVPVKVIGVDYSKLLTNPMFAGQENLRIESISRDMKNAAKEFDLTSVLVHTIRRNKEQLGKMPTLQDLSWSRGTEYDPDVVIFVHHDQKRAEGDYRAALGVGKNRDGADNELGGKIPAIFDGIRWEDAARPDEVAQMALGEEELP